MTAADITNDQMWAAIGDPTRLHILDLLLAEGPASASALGRRLPVTRQAVAKHLLVLERNGLVRAGRAGREVQYALDAAQFARACVQVEQVSRAWNQRLRRIKEIAESIQRVRSDTM